MKLFIELCTLPNLTPAEGCQDHLVAGEERAVFLALGCHPHLGIDCFARLATYPNKNTLSSSAPRPDIKFHVQFPECNIFLIPKIIIRLFEKINLIKSGKSIESRYGKSSKLLWPGKLRVRKVA